MDGSQCSRFFNIQEVYFPDALWHIKKVSFHKSAILPRFFCIFSNNFQIIDENDIFKKKFQRRKNVGGSLYTG